MCCVLLNTRIQSIQACIGQVYLTSYSASMYVCLLCVHCPSVVSIVCLLCVHCPSVVSIVCLLCVHCSSVVSIVCLLCVLCQLGLLCLLHICTAIGVAVMSLYSVFVKDMWQVRIYVCVYVLCVCV